MVIGDRFVTYPRHHMQDSDSTQAPPNFCPQRRRRRAKSRGIAHTEYVIVTATVFLVISTTLYTMGPKLTQRHREMVRVVVEKAP
jgi:hypothetical protein